MATSEDHFALQHRNKQLAERFDQLLDDYIEAAEQHGLSYYTDLSLHWQAEAKNLLA